MLTWMIGMMVCTLACADTGLEIVTQAGVQGGLVVHVGCGDGKTTAELCANERYTVQGFDSSPKAVENARAWFQKQGLSARVSAEVWNKKTLPYVDYLVNLVVLEDAGSIPMEEVLRVLAPNGVALVRSGSSWTKTVKPRPAGMAEWTHGLHGVNGNIASGDSFVGPPKHAQWLATPQWARTHRYRMPYVTLTANGRLFSIINDVPSGLSVLPDRLFFTARDAFNGLLLWKIPMLRTRETSGPEDEKQRNMPSLGTGLLYEPNTRAEIRAVASDDTVFLAFGKSGEVLSFDAATGEHLKTFSGTENTEQLFLHNDQLFLLRSENGKKSNQICALNPTSGNMRWTYSIPAGTKLTLKPVFQKENLYFGEGDFLICLQTKTGSEVWKKEVADGTLSIINFLGGRYAGPMGADRLILSDDVLLLSYMQKKKTFVRAFSAVTGEPLWEYATKGLARAGSSTYVIDGQVWVHDKAMNLVGLDLHTGEEKTKNNISKTFDHGGHHHRCYADRATENYVITGERGTEFNNIRTGEVTLNHWLRGSCFVGILPANGLLYKSQDGCGCYLDSKLNGHAAMASDAMRSAPVRPVPNSQRLEKGPAFAAIQKKPANASDRAWPSYRNDARRSNATATSVPAKGLSVAWSVAVGENLSGITAADGLLFTVDTDAGRVLALNADTGKEKWSFTAGGRVDTPPTLQDGLAVFGCTDGWVYCLDASTGVLVWRFLAAPAEQRMMNDGEVESVWPVHGSVVIDQNTVWCSAGRSSLFDGGIYLFALNLKTGKLMHSGRINDTVESAQKASLGNTGREHTQKHIGVLQDLLVRDGEHLFIQYQKLNADCTRAGKGGGSQIGCLGDNLLSPAWFSRTGWYIGAPSQKTSYEAGYGEKKGMKAAESFRQGQYLIFDDVATYGMRIHHAIGKLISFVPGDQGYELFSDLNESDTHRWSVRVPVRVEAMIVTDAQKGQAGKTLFVAGTPDEVKSEDPWAAIDGKIGGRLWAIDAETGAKNAEYTLPSAPVFDGLIAANKALYMATRDGRVICIKK